jgi:hypothetical protein
MELYNNFNKSTHNRNDKISFEIGEDTYFINFNNNRREYLNYNISITSVEFSNELFSENQTNKISFFSHDCKKDILTEIKRIINNKNIPYFIISTKQFTTLKKVDIEIIDLLVDIFNFEFIKFQNIDLFWYGIVINSFEKYVLEENLIETDYHELPKLDYNNLVNNNLAKQKEDLDSTMDKLITECKELTIEQLYSYKKIINKNMEDLNHKIEDINKIYDIAKIKIAKISEKKRNKNTHLKFIKIEHILQRENADAEGTDEKINELFTEDMNEQEDMNLQEDMNEQEDMNLQEDMNEQEDMNLQEDMNVQEDMNTNILLETENIDFISKELKTLINETENRSFAVVVHLYKIDVWEDIYQYLENLYNCNIGYDLYLNIALDNEEDIEKEDYQILLNKLSQINIVKNYYLTLSENKGIDIGGFFKSYLKMIELGLSYKNIIKIHSKTNFNWRFCLLYTLLGSEKIIRANLDLMSQEEIGMIGHNKTYININEKEHFSKMLNLFDINSDFEGDFIPGNIFWIKGEILDYYFTKDLLETLYNNMPKINIDQSFERMFGILVADYGKRTHSYNTK